MTKMVKLCMLIACFATATNATTYYVATSGSDTYVGTIAQPFKTIYKAYGTLQPGDTLLIRQGVYKELNYSDPDEAYNFYFNSRAKGTALAPIVIKSYPGERATLDGSLGFSHVYSAMGHAQNNRVIAVYGTQYLTIEDLEINCATGAIGIWLYKPNYITVRRCHIFNSADLNSRGVGIYSTGTGHVVEHCHIEQTCSHPFYISSGNGTYRNNHLNGTGGYSNQQGMQLQYQTCKGNRIYGNIVVNGQASGVVFSGMVSNNHVFNNVYIDCGYKSAGGYGYPLNFWHEDGAIQTGNKFYNNTVIGRANSGMIATTDGAPVEIFNNIFAPSTPVPIGGGTGYNIRSNIFWNVTETVPAGNLQKDPLLQDLSGKTADAAKLKSGSPCIDSGLAPGAPAFDYAGTSRPKGNGYDIGAFEYVASSAITAQNMNRINRSGISIRPSLFRYIYTVDGRRIDRQMSSGVFFRMIKAQNETEKMIQIQPAKMGWR